MHPRLYTPARPLVHIEWFVRQAIDRFAVVAWIIEPLRDSDEILFECVASEIWIYREFVPAIEKGIRRAAETAGPNESPVTGFRVIVFDGMTHAVDSRMSTFEQAAFIGLKRSFERSALVPVGRLADVSPLGPVSETVEAVKSALAESKRRWIAEGVAPALLSAGFEPRTPEIYTRPSEDLIHVVYLRGRSPNTWIESTLLCGICYPPVAAAAGIDSALDEPTRHRALIFRQSFAQLLDIKSGWSVLDPFGDINRWVEETAAGLEQVVLPYLNRPEFRSASHLLDLKFRPSLPYESNPFPAFERAVFLFHLGRPAEARALIEHEIESTEFKFIEKEYRQLLETLFGPS